MSNAVQELSTLDFDGVEWITELKNKLCKEEQLTKSDIQSAFDKILSDKKIHNECYKEKVTSSVEKHNSLIKLSENINVSGLSDNSSITFSPILTIIYGKNGSGKSSFYKILKDAFHSKQNIIGDIYKGDCKKSSAKIEFVDKGKHLKYQKKGDNFPPIELLVNWDAGSHTDSKIKFCDKEILTSSLTKKDTGWSLDRYKLSYYEKLREAVSEVESLVDSKISILSNSSAEMYNLLINNLQSEDDNSYKKSLIESKTDGTQFIQSLIRIRDSKLPGDFSSLMEKHEKEKNISIKDLMERKELLIGKHKLVDQLQLFCKAKTEIYSNLEKTVKNTIRIKELTESLDFKHLDKYKLLFDPAQNSVKFIELIQKIAETALSFGYEEYPNNVDKCFYCNQSLPDTNKELIKEVHKIIDTELNQEIDRLKSDHKNFISKIDNLLNCIKLSYQFSEIGDIYEIKTRNKIDTINLLNKIYDNSDLNKLKEQLNKSEKDILINDPYILILNLIECLCDTELMIIDSKLYELNLQITNIESIKLKAAKNIAILKDNKFGTEQTELINKLINTLNLYWKYKESKKQFQSLKTKISKDKGRVEDDLIRKSYLKKFNQHLEDYGLPNRDKISRPFSNPDGKSKISGSIQTKDRTFEISSILSEGEAKVYSLCDWFTELDFDESEILIFDDPITSLDQQNILKSVEKILSLCKEYQIIIFTHNFEFYHRLIQKSLGGSPLQKPKCELCEKLSTSDQCIGFQKGRVHKCGTYYQIEYILKPGLINEDVMFLSLDWEQRIEILRNNLLKGDIKEADKHLRTTINNFFERYVLNDIKRKVYKNNDLIKEWRDIKIIEEPDYNELMEIHNKVSGEGSIHEPSPEVRTAMDAHDYIKEFNRTVKSINRIRAYKNPTPPHPIDEII